MKKNGKIYLLVGLSAIFIFLVFTKRGKGFVTKAGEYIMELTDRSLDIIKRFEGFSATPYPDSKGMSIGYGHYIKPGESFKEITKEQADNLLLKDASIAKNAVEKLVKVPLNQSQFDALVSFVFNVGETQFTSSTLLRKLNAGDYVGAAEQFPVWNKATVPGLGKIVLGALVKRREKEKELFLA